ARLGHHRAAYLLPDWVPQVEAGVRPTITLREVRGQIPLPLGEPQPRVPVEEPLRAVVARAEGEVRGRMRVQLRETEHRLRRGGLWRIVRAAGEGDEQRTQQQARQDSG